MIISPCSFAQQSFGPRQLLSTHPDSTMHAPHLNVEHHQQALASATYDFLSAIQLVCGIMLVLILVLSALLKLILLLKASRHGVTSGPPLPITYQQFVMQQAPLAPPQPHNVLTLLSFTEQISIDIDDDVVDR
ncbi:hypothetical protein ACLB2K_055081 [Fragaria x ananassa]